MTRRAVVWLWRWSVEIVASFLVVGLLAVAIASLPETPRRAADQSTVEALEQRVSDLEHLAIKQQESIESEHAAYLTMLDQLEQAIALIETLETIVTE